AYLDLKNENRKCYNVTKLGCDFLANKFTGEKGIIFTARYVKRFNKMEQELKEQQPKLPTTYKEALQQLL
ncbi:Rha family transcriptional regulator, partial [Clostridioides difficile]